MAPKRRRSQKFYVQLPEDVMTEILSRLPVKTLLRFKLVCKRWRELISSSSFVSLHLDRSISNPASHSILVKYPCSSRYLTFDPVTFCRIKNSIPGLKQAWSFGLGMRCVGSINGLLCISDSSGKLLWLWNPCTNLYRMLPTCKYKHLYSISVAFDSDPIDKDHYKVVMIALSDRLTKTRMRIQVWSSSTNSDNWREVKFDGSSISYFLGDSDNIIVKGIVYWIVMDTEGKMFVASFDMNTEKPRLVPLPNALGNHLRFDLNGVNWNGTFGVATYFNQTCEVWTMENDTVWNKSWSHKLNIGILFPRLPCIESLNGKLLQFRRCAMLFWYNLETGIEKGIADTTVSCRTKYYVQSLVSIKDFSPLGDDARKKVRPRRLCRN